MGLVLGSGIESILNVKDESDVDSLFSTGGTTALLNNIKGLDDLSKLPLTYKEDWIARPDEFRLDMRRISWATREDRTLWEVIFTAGSTSDPTPFYDTSYDHYARISQLKRTAEIAGITISTPSGSVTAPVTSVVLK